MLESGELFHIDSMSPNGLAAGAGAGTAAGAAFGSLFGCGGGGGFSTGFAFSSASDASAAAARFSAEAARSTHLADQVVGRLLRPPLASKSCANDAARHRLELLRTTSPQAVKQR